LGHLGGVGAFRQESGNHQTKEAFTERGVKKKKQNEQIRVTTSTSGPKIRIARKEENYSPRKPGKGPSLNLKEKKGILVSGLCGPINKRGQAKEQQACVSRRREGSPTFPRGVKGKQGTVRQTGETEFVEK